MIKDYIVMFMNMETGKVAIDTFAEKNEDEARYAFRQCYRHANYKILATVEKPEIHTERMKYNDRQ